MRTGLLLVFCVFVSFCAGSEQEQCFNGHLRNINKELIKTLQNIEKLLPDDRRYFRILQYMRKKCFKNSTFPDIKLILDLYKDHVFSKWESKAVSLPSTFLVTFKRLLAEIDFSGNKCKQTQSTCMTKNHKSLTETFTKLDQKGRIKALSELRGLLSRIPEIMIRTRKQNKKIP